MVGHRAAIPRNLFGAGPFLLVFDEAGVKFFLEDTTAVHLERKQKNLLYTFHFSKITEILVTANGGIVVHRHVNGIICETERSKFSTVAIDTKLKFQLRDCFSL